MKLLACFQNFLVIIFSKFTAPLVFVLVLVVNIFNVMFQSLQRQQSVELAKSIYEAAMLVHHANNFKTRKEF